MVEEHFQASRRLRRTAAAHGRAVEVAFPQLFLELVALEQEGGAELRGAGVPERAGAPGSGMTWVGFADGRWAASPAPQLASWIATPRSELAAVVLQGEDQRVGREDTAAWVGNRRHRGAAASVTAHRLGDEGGEGCEDREGEGDTPRGGPRGGRIILEAERRNP